MRTIVSFFAVVVFLSALPPLSVAQDIKFTEDGQLDLRSQDTDYALKQLVVPKGFKVNLFASEKEFPELRDPLALQWDAAGRLWVLTSPTYPQVVPGVEPNDKLLILEDTDGDGKADKCKTFLDKLHVPTGFALGDGGAYVANQPNLIFARDTNGDDVADEREVILHGFGTEDSHHSISAFVWGKGGELYFQEGTFHHSQVETPHGPVRLDNSGVFRYEPRTGRLEGYVSYEFANPWGHCFDRWGQDFVADASGGANYYALPFSGDIDYPHKHSPMQEFTKYRVRPTTNCLIVSSRNFPDDMQGDFLLNCVITLRGTMQHKIVEEGSGFAAQARDPIIRTDDPNFRPIDCKFGPDGALYIADWFNPIIGHVYRDYSIRDKRRDKAHGRVWRIACTERPLLKAPKIAGRDLARMELRLHSRTKEDRAQVVREITNWIENLDSTDADYEHHLLEALWAYQTINHVEHKHLARMLQSPNPHARAAATRVLRYWRFYLPPQDVVAHFRRQANDEHPRVRLETIVAVSFLRSAVGAEIALETLKYPSDYYLGYALQETMATLRPQWKQAIADGVPFAANNPKGVEYLLNNVDASELPKLPRTVPVLEALLTRDGVLSPYRAEAIADLARLRQVEEVEQLLQTMKQLDASSAASQAVLLDVGGLLLRSDVRELQSVKDSLKQLSTQAQRGATRQLACAAQMLADGSVESVWDAHSHDIQGLVDLLSAVAYIPDAKLRAATYPNVAPLLAPNLSAEITKLGLGKPVQGRFVRIDLPGTSRTLTLAEVEVVSGGKNIAPQGKATQSSVAFNGTPERAIDGDANPLYYHGKQTHTAENVADPWWEVDLGKNRQLDSITVWNRNEGKGYASERLAGFRLQVLDERRQVVFSLSDNPAPLSEKRFDLGADQVTALRRAAIDAASFAPGHEAGAFDRLATLFHADIEPYAVIKSIQRLPKSRWNKDRLGPLSEKVVALVSQTAPELRTDPSTQRAVRFGHELAALLPPEAGKKIRASLGDLGVNTVVIRCVPHRMQFDRSLVAVQIGKPVELVFENTDIMPHNLVIGKPNSLDVLGREADRLQTNSNAIALQFVPQHASVFQATKLVQPRQQEVLRFNAPAEAGDYVYMCTYPGHWRTMFGTLKVVPNLTEYLDANPPPEFDPLVEPRAFVREWTVADLIQELPQAKRERNREQGEMMFAAASCKTCHRLRDQGETVGPDLTDVGKRLSPEEVLREIIEPSHKINEKFAAQVIETKQGQLYSGIVVAENDESISLISNPLTECEPQVVLKKDIAARESSATSIMPTGLLNTLDREEVLDLLGLLLLDVTSAPKK